MPPRIVILDPEVINQIAAGEVVERPASVVKELVENSLDAGARRVDVEIEGGGQALIRVADDGEGMTAQEARLALERHATSKLRRTDDLLGIRSMGFRGEALPSIASVSRLRLITRADGAGEGFALRVEGGRAEHGQPTGTRVGTTVEVTDLFFNTPARLKFLKSTATETAHIGDAVTELALANPGVHLTLTVDGRPSTDLPPSRTRLERARAALGRRGGKLAAGEREDGGIAVQACLGPPSESTRSARSVHLLVNRRSVRDRSLIHAVVAGYDALLEKGRFPPAVVHLDLDPALVDVNVHPQKIEVRFAEPGRVFAVVRRTVQDAVARGWPEEAAARYRIHTRDDGQQDPVGDPAGGYAEHRARLQEAARRFWSARGDHVAEGDAAVLEGPAGFFSSLALLGQALGTYLVLEGEGEIVLVDQHAAHERVSFERLRAAHAGGAVPSQALLIPSEVALDRRQAAAATEHAEALGRLGLQLEAFGKDAWMVRAVPTWLAGGDPAALVRDVLDQLIASGGAALEGEEVLPLLARMACHGSVRAGRPLEPDEVRALLAALDRLGDHPSSTSCPHGRPVLVRLSRAELERRFGR